jgi:exo-beta-1,3-glucanase (GH17 family)
MRILTWLVAALSLAAGASASPAKLGAALEGVRFVAYTPRGFDPDAGVAASPDALRADLALLRARFDGLVTYSSARGLDALPRLARQQGYRAVVLGVWNPADPAELEAAIAAARASPGLVVALALGNEGLFFERYDAAALKRAFARARAALPGVAVTTTEPFSTYLDPARAGELPEQDFLLPTVHPIDQPWFANAPRATRVDFVVNVVGELEKKYGKPVLVKETGVPSGPASEGFDEAAQAEFWRGLAAKLPPSRERGFVWFEAFDGPWKVASVAGQTGDVRASEAHWGLYRADGAPKPVIAALPPLLAGAWRLVSVEDRRANGEKLERLGAAPSGLLVYTETGRMSLQIAPTKPDAPGYVAYFGRFEVDAAAGTLTHVIERSLAPGHEGERQMRQFTLDGPRLTLRAKWLQDGEPIESVVVWERAE